MARRRAPFSVNESSVDYGIVSNTDLETHYTNRFLAAGATMDDILARFAATRPGPRAFEFVHGLITEYGLYPGPAVQGFGYNDIGFNTDAASELRFLGDECNRTRKDSIAASLYDYSLKTAGPGTVERSLAYARRVPVQRRMNKYEAHLQDVRDARQSLCPAGLANKLSERRGDAERLLDRARHARLDYVERMRTVDGALGRGMSEEERASQREQIINSVDPCNSPAALEMQRFYSIPNSIPRFGQPQARDGRSAPERPRVAGRPPGRGNAAIPALSECLEIKWSPETGRGVYATRDILPGETVAIDEPYIGCSTFLGSCCHYTGCLKPLVRSIRCPLCCVVFYCNTECLEKDNLGTHRTECFIIYSVKRLPGSASKELALKWFFREYTRLGAETYCSVVATLMATNLDPTTKGFDENNQFKSNSFLAAFCLESSKRDIPNSVLFFLNCLAVEILFTIISSGFNIPLNRIITLGASIAHMLKVLELNCQILSICDIIPNCEINKTAISLAYALYPSISLFNHSCDPNVRHSGQFSDRTKVLKTTQYISKGDQLFISYGPIFREFDETSREIYFNRLNFECVCKPCLDHWPSGQLIPDHISSLNLFNLKMFGAVFSACREFLEFQKRTDPEHYYVHLNYLYSFMKLIKENVKRPFKLYEDCLSMITRAQSCEKTLPFQFD